jgi:TonB family protein
MLNSLCCRRLVFRSAGAAAIVSAIGFTLLLSPTGASSFKAAPQAPPAQLQATLSGTVSDPTGAVLPGVRVTVSSLQGGAETRALTNESGVFALPNLEAGQYVVEANLPGFANWMTRIALEPGQRLDRRVVLALDGFAQSVGVTSAAPTVAVPAAPSRGPLRIGGDVSRPTLTQMVSPLYPSAARDAGVSGTVILQGVINPVGKVENLRVLAAPNGDLAQAATEAVAQWTYRPSTLNGAPVAVPTTINVAFSLQ